MGRMLDIAGGVVLGGIGCVLGLAFLDAYINTSYRDKITNRQTISGAVVEENFESDFFDKNYSVSVVRSDTGEKVVVLYSSGTCRIREPAYLNTLFSTGDLVELEVGELEDLGAVGGQKYVGISGRLADTTENK